MNRYERTAVGAALLIYSGTIAIIAGIIAAGCWLECKLFEYCLWSFFKVDVPWYLDLAGGVALNGATVVLAVICAIVRACGIDAPIIHSH